MLPDRCRAVYDRVAPPRERRLRQNIICRILQAEIAERREQETDPQEAAAQMVVVLADPSAEILARFLRVEKTGFVGQNVSRLRVGGKLPVCELRFSECRFHVLK